MEQTSSAPKIAITANSLGCSRDQFEIFTHISFSLHSGQGMFLRGANGSGKTTLLMVLAGTLPHSGKLEFSQNPKPIDGAPVSQLIHFIGHQNAIKSALTLKQNLKFWAQLYGGNIAKIPWALAEAGLANLDDFSAGHLSAGQKHRLSLCRLLISERPIWLLDEPSSALDEQGDKWVAGLISTHIQNQGIVIAATHRPIRLADPKSAKSLVLGEIK